jgi:outer membrane protein
MKKKIGIIFLTGALIAWGSWGWAAEPPKFGYVDMQRALNICEAGKEAKKLMTREVERMQKVMGAKQKELETLKGDLEKRGSVMSEAARRDKEADYQKELRDLQRMQRDYQDELRRKDREMTDRILKDLAEAAKKVGEEQKYTAIFERNQPTIIFISNALDLTDEIIKLVNGKKK